MVQCSHCRAVYDLGHGKRIARYADCDVFEAPCCHRQVDTRSWKTFPDYRQLEAEERVVIRKALNDGRREARLIFEDGSCERFLLHQSVAPQQTQLAEEGEHD